MKTGIIILIIVVFLGLIFWFKIRSSKKHLRESWTGTVIKKWIGHVLDEDGESFDLPTLKIQIDGGKKKKFVVSSERYNSLMVGDKVKKVSGNFLPEKA